MTARRHRWIGFAVAVAVSASLTSCATNKSLQRARNADQLREVDIAVAEYTKAVREEPNNAEAIQGLQRAKLRASEEHLLRGRRLYGQGHYDDALIELQLAVELNPTNADADRDLRAASTAVRTKLAAPEQGQTALQSLLQATRGSGACRQCPPRRQARLDRDGPPGDDARSVPDDRDARQNQHHVRFGISRRGGAARAACQSQRQGSVRCRRAGDRDVLSCDRLSDDHRRERDAGEAARIHRRRSRGRSSSRTRTSRK